MRFFVILLLATGLISCSSPAEFKTGTWRGLIAMQGHELPFNFDVEKKDGKYAVYLKNVTERILLDEVTMNGDSVKMNLHIFDAALHAKIDGDHMTGTFEKYYAPEVNLPFTATFGETFRFAKEDVPVQVNYTGKYQLLFTTDKDQYASVGIFEQKGSRVTGTFLTPMGDYRYLEGDIVNDRLLLSTFDGNHAFIFDAAFKGDSLVGDYYSGKLTHETFKGVRNEQAAIPDVEKQTLMREGYDRIDFSFPDMAGNKVTPSDERFKGKVLILQIFGTWCPNCMDETKFLTSWYKENHDRGVEILGLAYERKNDFEYAKTRINRMVAKLGVPYGFVFAGLNDKEEVVKTLPMLNKVIAFPTTIFIGKDGKVKHIHAGFEGPGTGIYYEKFKQRFNEIVNELLNEPVALNK
ncbi:MAG: TlpA family protein disulfide reductase [Bacteroidetes bacterium]|nr:TlpA family protein disulfide reductase [Bacteroidota bacterium]